MSAPLDDTDEFKSTNPCKEIPLDDTDEFTTRYCTNCAHAYDGAGLGNRPCITCHVDTGQARMLTHWEPADDR